MKKTVIILGIVIVILLGILAFYNPVQGPANNASSTPAGGIIGAPQPVVSSDGHVIVSSPLANDAVSSPVTITGTVTGGNWFFEASFPVKVLDGNGKVLGTGTAQAQPASAWMSTGTVPFIAKITFTAPKYATGTVLLQKDNPSGAPQNAAELHVPVTFAVQTSGTSGGSGSGISGTVLLGPTCPVAQNPPDPGCADKPYATNLTVLTSDLTRVAATVTSNANGTFRVALPPGQYVIQAAASQNILPRCASDGTIVVSAGTYTPANVFCDTGIR